MRRSSGRIAVVVTVIAMITSMAAVPAAAQGVDAAGPSPYADADRERDRAALSYAFDSGAVGVEEGPEVVPGSLIVTTSGPAALAGLLDAGRGTRFAAAGWQSATAIGQQVAQVRTVEGREADVAGALAAVPGVVAVEPDVIRDWHAVPSDPGYSAQWAHQRTNIEPAWDVSTGEDRPLIAVLDSGVDSTHPDLQGNVVSSLQSANGQILTGPAQNDECGIGHGTAVAGVVGARADNGEGIAGVLWEPRIIDVALTSIANGCPGGPPDSDTLAAIEHMAALPEPPLVINLSLGSQDTVCPAAYASAIATARARGIVVVASAGNDGLDANPGVPASCDGVISVGATNSSDGRAVYSQANPYVDITAPGGDLDNPPYESEAQVFADTVLSTCLVGGQVAIIGCTAEFPPYDGTTGTSFSGPYVAAVAALVRSVNPGLDIDQAEAVLENTARDLGPAGRDPEFGAGMVDVGAAVAAAAAGTETDLPPRPSFPTEGGPAPDPDPDPDPTPDPDPEPTPPGSTIRVAGSGATEPIGQAVAVSSGIPAGGAAHVVLARVDNFADALSGSAVGYGLGPLLYATSTGPLPAATRAELQRVLPSGRPVVLMGGTAALSATLDAELAEMGYQVVRLAGGSRYETAALAAQLVQEIKSVVDVASRDYAFVALAGNWPDAVGAGQLAAYYGVPILLSDTGSLSDITAGALQQLAPSQVFLVGGDVVLSETVRQQVAALGLPVDRLAGPTRVETSLAVSELFLQELRADGVTSGIGTVAVNLRRDFTHVLSATYISTLGNLFVPLEVDDGSVVTATTETFFCGIGALAGRHFIAGGPDLIADSSVTQLQQLYSRDAATC